ncbi:MAG: hypothetical protein AB7I36_18965 [Rhodospirillaceae bacterium]
MVAQSAFLTLLIMMLALFWTAGETAFLAPYKRLLFTEYGVQIGVFLLVVFINLFAACYGIGRWLFLKDTGHKLHHLDRQLVTRDTVLADLSRRMED